MVQEVIHLLHSSDKGCTLKQHCSLWHLWVSM